MPMVMLLPRTGRSPFQLYLISLILLAGLGILTGVSNSTITEAMGKPYSIIWGIFLTIGGFFILLGIYWPRNTVTGMLIERSGLVALGGACLIWSVLVIWRVQLNGLFSAMLTFGLFLACLAQWRWIDQNVKEVMKVINEH